MNSHNSRCPVCGGSGLISTVYRENIPSMQNYLFPLRDSAMNARMGSFELMVCDECGFAFNDRFDPGLIDADLSRRSLGTIVIRSGVAQRLTRRLGLGASSRALAWWGGS